MLCGLPEMTFLMHFSIKLSVMKFKQQCKWYRVKVAINFTNHGKSCLKIVCFHFVLIHHTLLYNRVIEITINTCFKLFSEQLGG